MITFNNKVVTYNHKWINGNGTPSPITSYNYQVDWIWHITEPLEEQYNVHYYSGQFNQNPFSQFSNYPGYAYRYSPYYSEWDEVGAGTFGLLNRYYSSNEYNEGALMKFVYKWSLDDTPANRRYIQFHFDDAGSHTIPANKFTIRVTDLNTSQVITSWNNPVIDSNGDYCYIDLRNYE